MNNSLVDDYFVVNSDPNSEFPYTEGLYNEILESFDYGREINYESFINAIFTDLHLEIDSRFMVFCEKDFVKFAYKYFPTNSNAWIWIRKIIGLKYLKSGKNEFIACYNRNDPQSKIQYQLRSEIEYNTDWVQLVSMSLPVIFVKGIFPVFVLIKEDLSDMAGFLTLSGGHIRFDGEIESIDKLYKETAIRETKEELGISDEDVFLFEYDKESGKGFEIPQVLKDKFGVKQLDDFYVKFNITAESPRYSISHYHIGRCYPVVLNEDVPFKCKMEKGKSLILYSLTEIDKNTVGIKDNKNHIMEVYNKNTIGNIKYPPDSWLQIVLNYLNSI